LKRPERFRIRRFVEGLEPLTETLKE